jgi:hypothetical protein
MKKYLAAIALAAALAHPASATTFPSLTTIYIGSGVRDDGGGANTGVATIFMCSNVSGLSAQVRFLVLTSGGLVLGQHTRTMAHGRTFTAATHLTATFFDDVDLGFGSVGQGVINIEATQSGVFCTAAVVNADAADAAQGIPLHLVRVNPHPGTVE